MSPDPQIEQYAREHRQFFDDRIPDLVRECLRDPSIETILEAGCGDGSLVHALVGSGLLTGRLLRACDLSVERVERVRDATGVEAFVDDVEALRNVPDGSIDLFISSQVIEHVDDRAMAQAIARVTHAGSRVYVATVFKRWYGWYFYRAPCGWAIDPTHLREYEADAELLDEFPSHQFRLVRNVKTRIAYPIVDPILRRMGAKSDVTTDRPIVQRLRDLRIPIVGYGNWELLFERI